MASRKPSMTPAERAVYERKQLRLKRERARLAAKRRAYALRIILLGTLAFLLFAAVFGAAMALRFHDSPEKLSYDLTFRRGDETRSLRCLTHDGVPFFSLNEVAPLVDARVAGDMRVMTLVFPDGGSASFYIGSDAAVVGETAVTLPGPVRFFAGDRADVFIPVAFFADGAVDGVTLESKRRGKHIAYTLVADGRAAAGFSSGEPLTPFAGSRSAAYPAAVAAYEAYLDPENADEYLLLVNGTHPLAETYVPTDLVDVADTRRDRDPVKLRETAAKALEALFIAMRAAGYTDVSVTGGYRSYADQASFFASTLARFTSSDSSTAYDRAAAVTSPEGLAEEQTGLACHIHNLAEPSQAFEAEDVYKWLYTHCADFGFIVRYPKAKSAVTGVPFRPWHFRYVGRTAATEIMKKGYALEEYLEARN